MNNKTRIILMEDKFAEELSLLKKEHFEHILNLDDKISELKVALDSRTQFEWGKEENHVLPTLSISVPIKRDVAPMMKRLLEKLNFTLTDIEAETVIEEEK